MSDTRPEDLIGMLNSGPAFGYEIYKDSSGGGEPILAEHLCGYLNIGLANLFRDDGWALSEITHSSEAGNGDAWKAFLEQHSKKLTKGDLILFRGNAVQGHPFKKLTKGDLIMVPWDSGFSTLFDERKGVRVDYPRPYDDFYGYSFKLVNPEEIGGIKKLERLEISQAGGIVKLADYRGTPDGAIAAEIVDVFRRYGPSAVMEKYF